MRLLFKLLVIVATLLIVPQHAFAASNNEIANFTSQTLNTLIILASLAATVFLIKGGYIYITSTGKPDSLEHAKITIRNALIGLVLVLSAGFLSTLLSNAFTTPSVSTTSNLLQLKPIEPVKPSSGLVKVMIDSWVGLLQNFIQSGTKPLVDSIISMLTTTPSIVTNSVIFNFWLIILGIVDSLFALLIAVLGFQFMSSNTFGFEEIEFKHLLPRIGLAFLGANTSIFLVDWVIQLCDTLIQALLHSTGGLTHAWILNVIDPSKLANPQEAVLLTLVFMVVFLVLAVILLIFYITRLIVLSLGAVLSPFIFLLLATPKFSDFAEVAVKSYLATVFSVFVHAIIIQLASAFLALPEQAGTNSLLSTLMAIGLLFTLLKTQSFMIQLVFYNSGRGIIKKIGGQIVNVITTRQETTIAAKEATRSGQIKAAREVLTV